MFDIGALDIEGLQQLRDQVNRRILEMRQTRGLALPELLRLFEEVKATLSDQGKEWYSLERWQYMDGEIRFWLNPKDQEIYSTGWFSIDNLIAWARDSGPVMAIEFEDETDDGITWFNGESVRPVVNKEDDDEHLRFQRFEP